MFENIPTDSHLNTLVSWLLHDKKSQSNAVLRDGPCWAPSVYLASLVMVDWTISKLDMTATQQEKKSQKSGPKSESPTRSYSQEFHENTKLTALI